MCTAVYKRQGMKTSVISIALLNCVYILLYGHHVIKPARLIAIFKILLSCEELTFLCVQFE